MLKRLELDNIGPFRGLAMDLGPRLNVITGDNSLGKSLLLEAAWWGLTGTWAGLTVPAASRRSSDGHAQLAATVLERVPYVNGYREQSETYKMKVRPGDPSWSKQHGRERLGAIVIHSRIDGGFVLCDPTKHGRAVAHHPADVPKVLDFTPEDLWNGNQFCNGLVRDLETWRLKKSEQYTAMERVLLVLSAVGEELRLGEPTRISVDDPREIPTLEMPYGSVPVTYASAGIKRVLALAYMLVWAWHEHVRAAEILEYSVCDRLVLLVDEVEAHLHPRWQRAILPSVLKVGEELRHALQLQVVVTTHAPLVLASLETLFDEETDRLFLLELDGNEVVARQLEWERHGEVSNWLQSEVFGLDSARSIEAEGAIEAAMAAMRKPDATSAELDRHEHELTQVLPDTDPTWLRWKWLRQNKRGAS